MFTYILAENLREAIFNFFVENIAGENSVQIAPNFPAKSLSIYFNEFFFWWKIT